MLCLPNEIPFVTINTSLVTICRTFIDEIILHEGRTRNQLEPSQIPYFLE